MAPTVLVFTPYLLCFCITTSLTIFRCSIGCFLVICVTTTSGNKGLYSNQLYSSLQYNIIFDFPGRKWIHLRPVLSHNSKSNISEKDTAFQCSLPLPQKVIQVKGDHTSYQRKSLLYHRAKYTAGYTICAMENHST